MAQSHDNTRILFMSSKEKTVNIFKMHIEPLPLNINLKDWPADVAIFTCIKCFETLNHFNCFILLQWFRKLQQFYLQLSVFRHLGCLYSRPHLTATNHQPELKQHPPITTGLRHIPICINQEKKTKQNTHLYVLNTTTVLTGV